MQLFLILIAFFLFIINNCCRCNRAPDLRTEYEWRYIDYIWSSDEHKRQAVRNGQYDLRNNTPIDVDVARDGRIFVTVIRAAGVPATVTTVTDRDGPGGKLLKPYPDWSWYELGNCNKITNVYRVMIDECNRIWVIDNGKLDDQYNCSAQLLVFDLANDRLLNKYKIPDDVAMNNRQEGLLVTPVVELAPSSCEIVNVFIADVNGMGLVVLNPTRTFRLEARTYSPDQGYSNVDIAGESFQLSDGIIGMAISPPKPDGGRDLFFRPFSSLALYAADTRVLTRSTYGDKINYYQGREMLPSQGTVMAFSNNGVLFFGLTKQIGIGCWNRNSIFDATAVDLAIQDSERLQFVSGMKFVPASRTGRTDEIWMLSNRFQKIMAGSQNFNEINFRVLSIPVDRAIVGTKCQNLNYT